MPTWTPVVDVSHHQGVIDFNVMRRRGVVGLILRATHGQTVDKRVHTYYRDALAAGFPADEIGFYSFFNPKRGTAKQTAHATANLIREVAGRTDVLYMLDIESYRVEPPSRGTVNLTGAAWARYIREHRDTFASVMPGCRIIAYTNRAYWNSADGPNDDRLAAELEWIVPRYPVYSHAGYDRVGYPGVPDQWDEWAFARAPGPFPPRGAEWSGWQFSAGYNRQGPVYGCQSSDLDLNIVDASAWARWTSSTTPEEDDMIAVTDRPYDSDSPKGVYEFGPLDPGVVRKIPIVFGKRAKGSIMVETTAGRRGWVSLTGSPSTSGTSAITHFEPRPGAQIRTPWFDLEFPDGHGYISSHVPLARIVVDVQWIGQ